MASDLRREQILDAAKRCFARYGYAGTTTRSVAQAAGISEGLLFKHFPTKAALYTEILAEACETHAEFNRLLGLEPSTATLVTLIRDMVRHFLRAAECADQEEVQRIRLVVSNQLDDGEFARLLYEKIGRLVAPVFTASLDKAVAAGDARRSEAAPLDLFWFAHQLVQMVVLARLPAIPVLSYPAAADLERQLCQFILRGIGLTDAAIASHLEPRTPESAPTRIAQDA